MPIRCKFVCQNVKKSLYTAHEAGQIKKEFLYTADFNVVCDGSEENKKFFKWTPSGKLEVGTYREDSFEVGKEYYVDITPVE